MRVGAREEEDQNLSRRWPGERKIEWHVMCCFAVATILVPAFHHWSTGGSTIELKLATPIYVLYAVPAYRIVSNCYVRDSVCKADLLFGSNVSFESYKCKMKSTR
jgi:hypothetical protein